MKQYKMFEHPAGKIEAVKQGWSWPGFFFNIIWAFCKRMWALGGILFAVFFGLGFIGGAAGGDTEQAIDVITSIANLIIAIVFGVNGNSWREKNLQGRGYEFRTTVTAANPEGATALFIKEKQTQ
jgi:hypothetical protein